MLRIPETTAPGRYTLDAGIYLPEDLSARLPLGADGQPLSRLLLGSLRVSDPLPASGTPSLPVPARLSEKVSLLGYDVEGCIWSGDRCELKADGPLTVTLYWRADGETQADYTAFVHVANAAGVPVAQHDSRPRSGEYPTPVWKTGDVVVDRHVVDVPTLPAGDYALLVGMYDLVTGLRLASGQAPDTVRLATIGVK